MLAERRRKKGRVKEIKREGGWKEKENNVKINTHIIIILRMMILVVRTLAKTVVFTVVTSNYSTMKRSLT